MTQPHATHRTSSARAAMALLLRLGVVTSAVIVMGGGAAFLATHGTDTAHFGVFQGEPSDLRGVSAIATGAADAEPRSVIMLGLLILIATPILRVAFSVAIFVFERDTPFVVVTLIVLAVLLFGLLGQHG